MQSDVLNQMEQKGIQDLNQTRKAEGKSKIRVNDVKDEDDVAVVLS